MESKKQKLIDIEQYYSIDIRSIWNGLKRESAAFWWLCIYVFFEYVRPQSIYPSIDIIPWAQISLLCAFATAYYDKSIEWVENSENKFLIFFGLIILLSSIFAFKPSVSLTKANTAINWVLIYFLIITVVNTEKRFFVFLLLLLLVNFKMSQFGFRTFAGRGFSFASWGVKGAPGWFSNSGEFGIEMTIFVPLSIAFIVALKQYWGRLKRWFFYLFPFTGLVTIAATSSRGAQLAILGVGIWFVLKSRLRFKAMLGILILGSVVYMIIPQEQLERFTTMGEDSTSTSRLTYWAAGMDVIANNPVLGVGYENWIDYCWFIYPQGLGVTPNCLQVHNTYIQSGVELGVFGLIVYIILLIYAFKLNKQTRQHAKCIDNKFIYYIAHGLDGGLIGFIISSTFISVLYYPFIWFQVATSVALFNISRIQLTNNKANYSALTDTVSSNGSHPDS